MVSPEHSHILKLKRAYKHLEDFDVELQKWIKSDDHSSFLDPDPDRPDEYLLKASVKAEPPDLISLLVSDIVHNFRSSLDHLVFALAAANYRPDDVPDKIAKGSQFPIAGYKDGKVCSSLTPAQRKRIRGINPQAKAIIETLQPYQNPMAVHLHPLWWLQYLSNIDKHRFLHLTINRAGGLEFDPFPEDWSYGKGGVEFFREPITRNTPVARINPQSIYGDAQVDMKIKVTPSIFFADGEVADKPVDWVLAEINTHIGSTIFPKLQPFL